MATVMLLARASIVCLACVGGRVVYARRCFPLLSFANKLVIPYCSVARLVISFGTSTRVCIYEQESRCCSTAASALLIIIV